MPLSASSPTDCYPPVLVENTSYVSYDSGPSSSLNTTHVMLLQWFITRSAEAGSPRWPRPVGFTMNTTQTFQNYYGLYINSFYVDVMVLGCVQYDEMATTCSYVGKGKGAVNDRKLTLVATLIVF